MGRIVRQTNSNRFNDLLVGSLIASIISFVIGLCIYLFSEQLDVLLGIIVGIIFIILGINSGYKYLKRDGAKLYSYNFIFAILLLIVGLAIIVIPKSIVNLLMVCVGLGIIIMGANKISYGVWFKIGNDASWLFTLVTGLMLIFLGILVLLNPFDTYMAGSKVIGIFIMLSSVLDFTDIILLKKRKDEIVKIFW